MHFPSILTTTEQIAREAGSILREYHRHKALNTQQKGEIDLVTEADHKSEALVVKALKEAFPELAIIGEEGANYQPAGAAYCWHVDPLDGTTNFAHRVPHFSVSLGLATLTGEPMLGVVYDPIRDECFSAYQGGGAFLNGQALRVSETRLLNQALLVTGFPYDKRTNPDNNLREYAYLHRHVQNIARMGSAALDLAYVAAGRFDAFWELRLRTWDVFAGMILVREAGGLVTDYAGGQAGLHDARLSLIASNGYLHEAIQNLLAEARRPA